MKVFGLSAVLTAVVIGSTSACSGGWSEAYRGEVRSQCANATSATAGYAVMSWCDCILAYRESERTEEEDRRARFGGGPMDLSMRQACRHAETPEITAYANDRFLGDLGFDNEG